MLQQGSIQYGTDHGFFVSSIAAGEDDGTGMQGVAPGCESCIYQITIIKVMVILIGLLTGQIATDNASTAIAQNNSWGLNYLD